MRMFSMLVLGVLLGACGYDFETEKDSFVCASDDDCIDGFACAGHTSLESDAPVTYCVESGDIEIAVWQETMPAFQSGCATQVWEFEWDAWMVVSDNETPPLTSLPPDPAQQTAFADAGGTCVGNISLFGEVRVMCRQPKGDLTANSAAMWVVMYETGGSAFVPQNVLGVAVTSAAVDPDTRQAPAPDEVSRHHQFDEYLGGAAARCAQALRRVCPENLSPTGTTVCTGCGALNPCPTHFSCDDTSQTCVPNPEI